MLKNKKDNYNHYEKRLIKNLRELSMNTPELYREWTQVNEYINPDGDTECLCGQKNITNVCVIENIFNGNRVEIGNVCNKKFGADIPKIFQKMKSVYNNELSSFNINILNVYRNRDIITKWEHSFYDSILNKTKLSHKQVEVKRKINIKMLEYFYRNNINTHKILTKHTLQKIKNFNDKILKGREHRDLEIDILMYINYGDKRNFETYKFRTEFRKKVRKYKKKITNKEVVH